MAYGFRLGQFPRRAFARLVVTGSLLFGGAVAASAGCGVPQQTGYRDVTLQVDGAMRQGVAYLPSGYTGQKKMAVVFDFHGSNSFPRAQMQRSSWDKVAEREGFIVFAPQGSLSGSAAGTFAWNVPGVTFREGGLDEVAFIKAAVERVKEDYCVDPERIYASGYSGGGRMLSAYLCAGTEDFAGAGFVNSLRAGLPAERRDGRWMPDATSCKPARPVSIMAFHGVKDEANPYAGGGKAYWQYGFRAALQRWTELDGCKGKAVAETAGGVTFSLYDACGKGARIAAFEFAEGTHDWPRPQPNAGVMAAASRTDTAGVVQVSATRKPGFDPNIDPAARMWDFFRRADQPNVVATANSPQPALKVVAGCGEAATIDQNAEGQSAEGMTCSNSKPAEPRRSGLGAKDAL
ncbi:PHB depolymerase family esterase [Rhizobium sp. CSW-27]|uniref:alpha/beta hydrolase family esterase n=1 Tax=Rhizobium sp. CSW-27 TaxID=2839985 RepID=UPI001C013B6D|nr:PHB depolymerase family esterase [Rhizobium sp. CSW-27]MBT9369472.1 polyhydroxybutyrate depolymerase [Rhizobium sp. CSW-27]